MVIYSVLIVCIATVQHRIGLGLLCLIYFWVKRIYPQRLCGMGMRTGLGAEKSDDCFVVGQIILMKTYIQFKLYNCRVCI